MDTDKVIAPQVVAHPGTRTTKGISMATQKSSAPHAHPSTDDHDDTVEAHYACLERLCACYSGWVFVGYKVLLAHFEAPLLGVGRGTGQSSVT